MKKILLPKNHSIVEFVDVLNTFEEDKSIQSLIVLGAAGTQYPKTVYDTHLQSSALKIIGGIFPEIVFEGQRYNEGTILIGISEIISTVEIEQFENEEDIADDIENVLGEISPRDMAVFIFVDALVKNKPFIFDNLYNTFGTIPKYVGAGTGSLEFNTFPTIFTNKGILTSAAVIGMVDLKTSIGVAHGWEAISEPLKVTESKNNEIISLNWRPAMEVYQEIIEKHSKQKFNFDDFLGTVKSYPLGIAKLDSEMVVRDPFMQKDNSIFTLDDIEQGSHINVLYGNLNSLLKGASRAKGLAFDHKEDKGDREILLIDCITRVLFMNEHYDKELEHLDPHNKGFGALTLGEIANNGDAYLEIFNKTAVVCAFHE